MPAPTSAPTAPQPARNPALRPNRRLPKPQHPGQQHRRRSVSGLLSQKIHPKYHRRQQQKRRRPQPPQLRARLAIYRRPRKHASHSRCTATSAHTLSINAIASRRPPMQMPRQPPRRQHHTHAILVRRRPPPSRQRIPSPPAHPPQTACTGSSRGSPSRDSRGSALPARFAPAPQRASVPPSSSTRSRHRLAARVELFL